MKSTQSNKISRLFSMNVMDNVNWNFENVTKIKQVLKIIIFVLYKKYSLTLFRLTYSPIFFIKQ